MTSARARLKRWLQRRGHEIGLARRGDGGVRTPVLYVDVASLDELREGLLAEGAKELVAPRKGAPSVRICVLADADGGLRGA